MDKYSDLLKRHGLKVTPQRLEMVTQLDVNGHMSIDNIYEMLLLKYPSISLATIYKNINSMLEKLFVREVKIPNRKSVYELTKEYHSHLVCKKCNEVMDISIDINKFVDEVEEKNGYEISETNLVFLGTCKKCLEAN